MVTRVRSPQIPHLAYNLVEHPKKGKAGHVFAPLNVIPVPSRIAQASRPAECCPVLGWPGTNREVVSSPSGNPFTMVASPL